MSKAPQKVSPDLDTPTDLSSQAVNKVSEALNVLLADAFALYLKTKNFHWHISGRHFRDYHLLLDEQSDQIFATTDQLAERVRKIGGTTLKSIGQIAKLQTIKDNNEDYVPPREMLRELMQDNKHVAAAMRKAHEVCDDAGDVASAPASSRTSSTRPSAAPGSCSKPQDRKARTRRRGTLSEGGQRRALRAPCPLSLRSSNCLVGRLRFAHPTAPSL
ncbi:DNA-binding ferritin-like protein [Bradyrhizobium sp. USDA 3051]